MIQLETEVTTSACKCSAACGVLSHDQHFQKLRGDRQNLEGRLKRLD